MSYETILFDVVDHVATITLNRPNELNAFNISMIAELDSVWKSIRDDDDIRVAIIRADGRAFCVGRDAQEIAATPPDQLNPLGKSPLEALSPKWQRVWKPVIVAVNGLCGASAFYWVNEADIVIASEDAVFFDSHISVGAPALNEVLSLTRRIPIGEAMRLALLSLDERMSVQRALQIGLVSEIVPREDLWDRAAQLASIIASKSPIAVQTTVRGVWESLELGRAESYGHVTSWRTGPDGEYPPAPRAKAMLR
jgi:enoyl-CoA hydratase/carnithine racemase